MIIKNKSSIVALIIVSMLGILASQFAQADDVPLAARLLAEPYQTTGVRVTLSNLSHMYGLANDGTHAYAIENNGNIVSTPLAAIEGQEPGSSMTAEGTIHTVGWSVGDAPAWPGVSDLSLSYGNGCIFITNNSNTLGGIHLYCIDVSDYSVTDIPVPEDKPLPAGNYYVKSSLIDFPDGRIGKVSAETYSEENGQYESTLRTYTLTGTGKNVTIAWSQDFVMGDPVLFAVDEHGIATDGTYLYRIQWRDYNPNTKVWTLSGSGIADVVYSGQYTMPFDNMHFLSHNHTDNYYLVGHFSSNHFFITTEADPGPGPGNGLIPTFDDVTSTTGGYTVQINNYDTDFSWDATTTDGTVEIDETGLITVSDLSEYQSATTTVTTARDGYADGSASVFGTAAADPEPEEDEESDNTEDDSETCPEIAHAATYNSYPTCGVASCASGYKLSRSRCVVNHSSNYSQFSNPESSLLSSGSANSGSGGTTQIQAKIAALIQQIADLKQRQAALAGETSGSSGNSINFIFAHDLQRGDFETDVVQLQIFLNGHGFAVAQSGPGSLGNETAYFGQLTQAALAKFQQDNNISPAAGYFGPITRGIMNKI